MTKLDIWAIEDYDPDARIPILRLAIAHMVIAEVVTQYTLFDEILSNIICKYFFRKPKKPVHWGKLWKTKRFSIFVNYLLDETYLLKKMEVVHAIEPLPPHVRSTIHRLNHVRNALAHSLFPENRKEYRKLKRVDYDGKDIRTAEGLDHFNHDISRAWAHLAKRHYGVWFEEGETAFS